MYLSRRELYDLGFSKVGKNLKISDQCSFYQISGSIGDNVRIDDFCILKGQIEIGSFVHVAAYCSISGAWAPVTIGDYVTLSNRVSVFTGSDDFRADGLSGTAVEYKNLIVGPVIIGFSSLVGAHSVLLPHSFLPAASAILAMSVIHRKSVIKTRNAEKIRAQVPS
ncbi:MAG: acyltransferase [Patescibacteria group bacterium]|nr:acyltransferase [Patescibacteria group bacterium]